MMKPTRKGTMVPTLRFPEFQEAGEWSVKQLNEICAVNPANSELPESFVYIDLESVEAGILKTKAIISREKSPTRAQRLLAYGDVIFQIVRPYQRNNFYFRALDDVQYVASTGYAQLRALESRDFLFQVIHTDDFVEKVITKCTGSSYPAINPTDLAEISITVPKPAEQQKIADCLDSLDELITLEAQQLDALKTHKNGLMQQLFPAPGETLPKQRFPEFRDAGEWATVPMGSLLARNPEYGVNASGTAYSADLPTYLRITDIDEDGRFLSESKVSVAIVPTDENYLELGDIVLARTGASVGKSYRYRKEDGRLVFAGFLIRIRPEPTKANPIFLANFLTTQQYWSWVGVTSARSGQPGINGTEYSSLPVPVPPYEVDDIGLSEQQRIADSLASLDDLITAQNQKIGTLKTFKKGLMQQLFPVLDEVQ